MMIPLLRRMFSNFSKRRTYDGVIITPAGRDEIWLIDGARKINIFIELSHGDVDRVIVRSSIKAWEPPYESEPLSQQKIDWIIRLVSKYLDDIGESHLIE